MLNHQLSGAADCRKAPEIWYLSALWVGVVCGIVESVRWFLGFRIPLSSDRQHLSYGDCLEVRGEIIRTVLCCIVY